MARKDKDTTTTPATGEEDGTSDSSGMIVDWGSGGGRPIKPGWPGDGDDWATTMACGEEGNDCGFDPDPIEVTTMAIGEEGDPGLLEPDPIEVSTMALGEEGDPDPDPIEVTTMAIGEEGGDCFIDLEPIEATTMAIGEEGGGDYDVYM